MKVRPLVWREAHPYLIADRMEDITAPESLRVNPKTDRNISLYGYIRGTSIKNHSNVHIAGKFLNSTNITLPCLTCRAMIQTWVHLNASINRIFLPALMYLNSQV